MGAVFLALGSVALLPGAGRQPRLSVVYQPPKLSVEARGIGQAEVSREIGTTTGGGRR